MAFLGVFYGYKNWNTQWLTLKLTKQLQCTNVWSNQAVWAIHNSFYCRKIHISTFRPSFFTKTSISQNNVDFFPEKLNMIPYLTGAGGLPGSCPICSATPPGPPSQLRCCLVGAVCPPGAGWCRFSEVCHALPSHVWVPRGWGHSQALLCCASSDQQRLPSSLWLCARWEGEGRTNLPWWDDTSNTYSVRP